MLKQSGAGTTAYIYNANGELSAEYSTQSQSSLCTTCYLTADALGSVRLVSDASGAAKALHDFLPFGEEIPAGINGRSALWTAADGSTQRFTGKERDAETGLDYFGARYFSGAQGRFTSPDQALIDQDRSDPQSWNLYSYVRNNPLKYTDPKGEDCVYTNNYNNDGTVAVERGDCSQKNGTFVNGTIDTK